MAKGTPTFLDRREQYEDLHCVQNSRTTIISWRDIRNCGIELAFCRDVIFDIMTHPWVLVDTHSTGVRKGGCGWFTNKLHLPNAVRTEVTPLRNHQLVAEPLVHSSTPGQVPQSKSCTELRIPEFKIQACFIGRVVDTPVVPRRAVDAPEESARQSTRQRRRRKRSTLAELEAVPAVTQRQDFRSQRVQTTVLGPQAQFIDEMMAIPVVQRRKTSPQSSEDVQ